MGVYNSLNRRRMRGSHREFECSRVNARPLIRSYAAPSDKGSGVTQLEGQKQMQAARFESGGITTHSTGRITRIASAEWILGRSSRPVTSALAHSHKQEKQVLCADSQKTKIKLNGTINRRSNN